MSNASEKRFTAHSTDLTTTCEVCLADTSGYAVIAKCSSTPPATADTFQVGCLMISAGATAEDPSVYMNTGTTAAPVWTLIGAPTLPSEAFVSDNDNGANNAICVSLTQAGVDIPVTSGTRVAIKLTHTLQKGTNTLNLNGTTKSIVNSTNLLSLTTPYAVGGIIEVIYTPGVSGGVFQDLKQ